MLVLSTFIVTAIYIKDSIIASKSKNIDLDRQTIYLSVPMYFLWSEFLKSIF